LKTQNIKGAILDVLENEDLKSMNPKEKQEFETLAQAPNVIITPHIAGYTYEATRKMSSILLEKIGYL
jgi:D-3-phosphoglycerate dehydrogenase